MPTIAVSYNDLIGLIGQKIPLETLEDRLFYIKAEVEDITPLYGASNEIIDHDLQIEITSDRPDLLSASGLARVLKGIYEIEMGLQKFDIDSSGIQCTVDSSVLNVRPYIVCGVVKNVHLTDALVRQLMQLQEKIHDTHCRRRRKGSIGLHNLDAVEPPFTYLAETPENINFVPLNETEEMNGYEILRKIPKGRDYAHIIDSFDRYPLLVDKNGDVLSLPPIINGNLTRVDMDTRNLFFDVTGTDEYIITYALHILLADLYDRGAKIESVEIIYSDKTPIAYPNFTPSKMNLSLKNTNELLGFGLNSNDLTTILKKMRFDSQKIDDDTLEVLIPVYRPDFLHEVDLIEDVSIGYGYDIMEPELPQSMTVGGELPLSTFERKIKDLMVGMGFIEVLNYVLTSKYDLETISPFTEFNEITEIANPVSEKYTVIRNQLLPGLISFLSKNLHSAFPQKIFEIGPVGIPDSSVINKVRTVPRISAAITDYATSYEHIQSVVGGLLNNLGIPFELKSAVNPSFLKGRVAEVFVKGVKVGILGELHPEVLLKFKLENPTAVYEFDELPLFET
ncbi:MAG: phenylalanine--tRNA ligase subunit beta [Candidatus Lokiarchaeota archaeon]|nr:phenylalanine--tRNA ligase subunit beta [Candidatus Lokiarchaeota archaeon]